MPGLLDRVAAAPITWGVCEVPGWGYQLEPDRVLAEMAAVGFHGTELGPEGFLPAAPGQVPAMLEAFDLRAVGAFVPIVLHEPGALDQELERLAEACHRIAASGGDVCVIAATAAGPGYGASVELDPPAWKALLAGLDRAAAVVADRGLTMALHPHVGTAVERRAHVDRVLEGSSTLLCLDTGHLLLGGSDPLDLARSVPERIAHVHLKDVDPSVTEGAAHGDYRDSVASGLYRALGDGSAAIEEIVRSLEAAGYGGWYVVEQDIVLAGAPAQGEGPRAAAEKSLAFLKELAERSSDPLSFVGEGRGAPHRAAPQEAKGGRG